MRPPRSPAPPYLQARSAAAAVPTTATSRDLRPMQAGGVTVAHPQPPRVVYEGAGHGLHREEPERFARNVAGFTETVSLHPWSPEIGRASCRERVCQYV